MEIVTGDKYLESLVKFADKHASGLLDGTTVLKLNPVGLHYVHSRLDSLLELERLIAVAPVDYLRAYVSDLGDHRALEQLRRILCRVTLLKIVSVLPHPARDPTPLSLIPFPRLKVLELRGCDLSSSAAKGLLELRHSLESLVCLNSTDALRHVFASRIADIKDSPQWSRLSFVSCACNGLILMDESLQLLPAVETLDLSRNKFAKVDNLRKCTRLTHLDLGFNQLRSVSSFSEVTCHITKLVLRNNALTSLRGIETLKSIEGLDVSYNIISNYLELEVLSSLPFLTNVWLEGNPLCCARWYRSQVFSFFSHPEQVKLDNKEMSTEEFFKRQIIVARRQRKPSSYGFYSPAREDKGGGLTNGKRKKMSRLACIESEDNETNVFLEQESLSCENDVQGGLENSLSDNEGEITSLINRIEFMKKERSKLWLEDFKDWIDQGFENQVSGSRNWQGMPAIGESNLIDKSKWRHLGDSSRCFAYVSDLKISSGGDRSTDVLEFDSPLSSSYSGNHDHQWIDSASENVENNPETKRMVIGADNLRLNSFEGEKSQLTDSKSVTFSIDVKDNYKINAGFESTPTANNSFRESMPSFGSPGSPPHYQEDILYRRHYMEEEFLQVSADSFSVASSDSDSDTSCDEDDGCQHRSLSPENERFVGQQILPKDLAQKFSPHLGAKNESRHYVPEIGLEEWGTLEFCSQQASGKHDKDNHFVVSHNDVSASGNNNGVTSSHSQDDDDDDNCENRAARRKPKRRVVSLLEENSFCFCGDVKDKQNIYTATDADCIGRACAEIKMLPMQSMHLGNISYAKHETSEAEDYVEKYFNSLIADTSVHETCKQIILCNCIAESKHKWGERQVAVILSSECKLYVISCSGDDGSGNSLSLLTSHKVEDVREVLIGLGLLVFRVYIDKDTSYMLITKNLEKTRHLFSMLGLFSCGQTCSLRSLDKVQMNLFAKQIYGGLGITVYQYSMVLFSNRNSGEEKWALRSIFVAGGHLFVCIEDLQQFGSLSSHADAASYFLLDSCCFVADVSHMVIDVKGKQCVTLTIKTDMAAHCCSSVVDTMMTRVGFQNESTLVAVMTWKLKWFSAESLFEFVTLLKAIHREMTTSNLSLTCNS